MICASKVSSSVDKAMTELFKKQELQDQQTKSAELVNSTDEGSVEQEQFFGQ